MHWSQEEKEITQLSEKHPYKYPEELAKIINNQSNPWAYIINEEGATEAFVTKVNDTDWLTTIIASPAVLDQSTYEWNEQDFEDAMRGHHGRYDVNTDDEEW